ncbi:ABC transporter permease [Actinopolyspora mortivallis]|uniref:ABC transporter permease n=1 Tax=Actinopolyspora mortivallis TaxID=33906 RepID=UPI0012EDBD88|nr:ABC transporter permease [Actinopolyspora mortivallis]
MRRRAWLSRWRPNSPVHRALGLLVTLTVLVSALTCVTSAARSAIERDVLRSGGLTQVHLSSIETGRSVRGLDTENLNRAREVEHVAEVVPDYVSSVYTGDSDPGAPTFDLTTHSWRPSTRPSVVRGELPRSLRPGQIVLPAHSGGVDFNRYVGKTLPAAYTRATGEHSGTPAHTTFEVVATYDPERQSDGPDTAYLAPETAATLAAAKAGTTPERYRSTTGARSAVVSVTERRYVSTVARELRRLGFSATPATDRMRDLPGVFGAAERGHRIGVLVVLAVAVLTGSLHTRSGLLDRPVSAPRRGSLGEAMLTGLLAGVIGSALGLGGALLLRGPSEGLLGLEVPLSGLVPGPLWATAVVLTPLVGLTVGSLLGGRLALRRDPHVSAREQS